MKNIFKLLTLSFFLSIFSPVFAQVNIVNVENAQTPTEGINGISFKEDIGGVDIEVITQKLTHHYEWISGNGGTSVPYYGGGIGHVIMNTNGENVPDWVTNLEPQKIMVPSAIKLTNYNSFPVTVLFQYTGRNLIKNRYYDKSTQSITFTKSVVVPPNKDGDGGVKTIFLEQSDYPYIVDINNLRSITRKVGQ